MQTKKWHVTPAHGGGGGTGPAAHTPPPHVVTFTFNNGEGAFQVSHPSPLVVLPGQTIIFIYPDANAESVFIPLDGIFEHGSIGSDQIFPFVDLMHVRWPNILSGLGVTLTPQPNPGTILTALGSLPLPHGARRPRLSFGPAANPQTVVLTVKAHPARPRGTTWAYAVHDNALHNFAIGNSPPPMMLGP